MPYNIKCNESSIEKNLKYKCIVISVEFIGYVILIWHWQLQLVWLGSTIFDMEDPQSKKLIYMPYIEECFFWKISCKNLALTTLSCIENTILHIFTGNNKFTPNLKNLMKN